MEFRRAIASAREDKSAKGREFGLRFIHPHFHRFNPRQWKWGKLRSTPSCGGWRSRQMRTDREKVVLEKTETLPRPFDLNIPNRTAQRGVQLIDRTICLDAHVVLGDTPSAEERSLSIVTRTCVNLHGSPIGRGKGSAPSPVEK
jgi:hypothetical protein